MQVEIWKMDVHAQSNFYIDYTASTEGVVKNTQEQAHIDYQENRQHW